MDFWPIRVLGNPGSNRRRSNRVLVAELQLEVARLRFEKGLSDNFNVIDAENLLNSARLLELDSRFAILLARLDCLFASGALSADAYRSQP